MNHSNINGAEFRSQVDFIYSAVMTDSDALEDAKMTLEVIKQNDPGVYDEMINDTLALIRKALSNSILAAVDRLIDSDQEPVAWMHTSAVGNVYFRKKRHDKVFNPQPVYLSPPLPLYEDYRAMYLKTRDELAKLQQREWVALTHEEILDCMDTPTWLGTLHAIQAKIKEKNS